MQLLGCLLEHLQWNRVLVVRPSDYPKAVKEPNLSIYRDDIKESRSNVCMSICLSMYLLSIYLAIYHLSILLSTYHPTYHHLHI